ncbi:MAG: hypothetical protein PHO37_02820 [Kiritimatiellae bacterium]|nr:hypothetical protein [Kiritimatiellia bacterium]
MSQTKIMKPFGAPLADNHLAAADCFILLRQGYGGHSRSNPTPRDAPFTNLLQNAALRATLVDDAVRRC